MVPANLVIRKANKADHGSFGHLVVIVQPNKKVKVFYLIYVRNSGFDFVTRDFMLFFDLKNLKSEFTIIDVSRKEKIFPSAT